MNNIVTLWPLIFSFRIPVHGNGFVAQVAFRGHTLAEQDADGVWLSGVNPGGVAGGGCDFAAAQSELGRCVAEVLFELAAEAGSFTEFSAAAEAFFAETDENTQALWWAAVTRVRANRLQGDVIGLETRSADDTIAISVVQMLQAAESRVENNYQPEAALAA